MKRVVSIIVIGFALFAMFFGAGNLIFPPYLGVCTGSEWLKSFTGFIIGDVGLAVMLTIIMAKNNGDFTKISGRVGRRFSIILGIAIVTCLGPLLAIPRTAATTFEVGVHGIFPGASPIISSIVFFFITMVLTIKPSKVIDIIGSILTPALLICLAILIFKGINSPIGEMTAPRIGNVFSSGLSQGYQTMDALGALMFASIITGTIKAKGFSRRKDIVEITFFSGMIAAIGLIAVYAGLAYIGASSASLYKIDITQTNLIVDITQKILGLAGKAMLGAIVSLACLTTSIGLTSSAADFYEKQFKGKISYSKIVIAICLFSTVVSNFGVSAIIKVSAPILEVIYPMTIVLGVMDIFSARIKTNMAYKGAVIATFIISVFNLMNKYGISINFIKYLPFNSSGFNWIIPAVLGAAAGAFYGYYRGREMLNVTG